MLTNQTHQVHQSRNNSNNSSTQQGKCRKQCRGRKKIKYCRDLLTRKSTWISSLRCQNLNITRLRLIPLTPIPYLKTLTQLLVQENKTTKPKKPYYNEPRKPTLNSETISPNWIVTLTLAQLLSLLLIQLLKITILTTRTIMRDSLYCHQYKILDQCQEQLLLTTMGN